MNDYLDLERISALNQADSNKDTVRRFINSALGQADPSEATSFLSENYIQHSPTIPDGKKGFIEYFRSLRENFPMVKGQIKKMIAEGDLVVVHMHAVREPGDDGLAIVDIFRFESGFIAEHWEVRQAVVQSTLHGNPMI